MFKLRRQYLLTVYSDCFNPSVGILGVQACPPEGIPSLAQQFQSLGRDSGCSSWFVKKVPNQKYLFQSLGRDSGCSSNLATAQAMEEPAVSIPRSGFWVFKLVSSLSIVGPLTLFQSLGRDSGCSSALDALTQAGIYDVSIPRSGFWVFKLENS